MALDPKVLGFDLKRLRLVTSPKSKSARRKKGSGINLYKRQMSRIRKLVI